MSNDGNSKFGNLHEKIVRDTLPRLAMRLKQERMISKYDRKSFKIRLVRRWQPFLIVPDCVLYLPRRRRVLVEVVNPEKAKRFIGELVYPHILGCFGKIEAYLIFVLNPQECKKHERSLHQRTILHQCFKKQVGSCVVTWPNDDDAAYSHLKNFIRKIA